MAGDQVFAAAKPEDVFVFRHNFADNKWENIFNQKDGSATVTFRKRDNAYFIRISPVGGGEKEEHQLSQTAHVKDSGGGFIQVPLPDTKQLLGIKFKNPELATILLQKIRTKMSVQGAVTMQAVVLDEKPSFTPPNPENLPKPMGYGPVTLPATTTKRKPAPPPPLDQGIESIDSPNALSNPPNNLVQTSHHLPPVSKPVIQPVPSQHHQSYSAHQYSGKSYVNQTQDQFQGQYIQPVHSQQNPFTGQPAINTVQPGFSPRQPVNRSASNQTGAVPHRAEPMPNLGQQMGQPMQPPRQWGQQAMPHIDNPGQPMGQPMGQPVDYMRQQMSGPGQHNMVNLEAQGIRRHQMANPVQQMANPGRQMANPGQQMGYPGHQMVITQEDIPPPLPVRPVPTVRPDPDIPSLSMEDNLSDHALFLANAINSGDFDKAHKMINMLQKIAQKEQPQKKVVFSYTDNPNCPSQKDDDVTLNITVEFQNRHKSALQLYLNFKCSLRIIDIQQHLELSHHIPKATQNWIIGDELLKGDQLTRTLKELKIEGKGTRVKVFVYVMHSKKAQVPKEEFEAIRQCQQEEWERKRQGRRQPWEQPPLSHSPSPPDVPPRSQPQNISSHSQERRPKQAPAAQYHQQQHPPINGPPLVRQAWGPTPTPTPTVTDDTYSRFDHKTPAVVPPPDRRALVEFDPAYDQLRNYQHHPGEDRPHPPPQPYTRTPHIQYSNPSTLHLLHQGSGAAGGGVGGGGGVVGGGVGGHVAAQAVAEFPQARAAPPEARLEPSQMPQTRPPPNSTPAPPPPPQQPIGWSCPRCTFINKPRRPGCEVCSADRPPDYKIPDVPMDEDEARIMAGLQGSDTMFYQFEEEEKKKQDREREKNFQALVQAEEEALITNEEVFECPICITEIEVGDGVTLRNCLHQFCKDCLKQSIMMSPDAEVKCPYNDDNYQCNVPLPEREIKQLVDEQELQDLYKRGLREAENAAANSYHCQTTDCEGFCFYEDEVNQFQCPLCNKENCLTCKAIHENMNCQEYQDDLKRRAANDEAAKATQEMLQKMVEAGDAMNCPSCKIVVQKKDGCDWIRCSVCKTEICWATKQARWGPKGKGDKSGGCHCRENGRKCHPLCRNCH